MPEIEADAASADMAAGKKYVSLAVVIGILQVIDALLLASNQGVVETISFSTLISLVEFLWVIASVFVIIRVRQTGPKFLAICFVAYNVVGWAVGASMELSEEPLVVPLWFALVGGAFGFAYSAASAWVARAARGNRAPASDNPK